MMADDSKSSLLSQWRGARAQHADAVVLVRVGDFYELFGPDAELGVKELGLTLTSRAGPAGLAMAGIPAKARDEYVGRLVARGHRVAVLEQVQDPANASGTVGREVTEVATPGTVLSDALLADRRNNFLAAVAEQGGGTVGIAAIDVTTGEVLLTLATAKSLEAELARLEPAELLVPNGSAALSSTIEEGAWRITRQPALTFEVDFAEDEIRRHYGVRSLEGLGINRAQHAAAIGALGAILAYLRQVQPGRGPHLRVPRVDAGTEVMSLDEMTRRNLELVESLRPAAGAAPGEGTLLGVVDETLTPMGARLLRSWLLRPLVSLERISARQRTVAELVADGTLRDRVRRELAGIRDLERLAARIAAARVTPRDLRALAGSLSHLPPLAQEGRAVETDALGRMLRTLDSLSDLREAIDRAIDEQPAASLEDGGVIRAGYDEALDQLRATRSGATDWMSRLQAAERERTGIAGLKVGFNRVFGYFLEVPRTTAARVPADYERRQTLANAERFVTPELKTWEATALDADARIVERERALFEELRAALGAQTGRIQGVALRIAALDVLTSFAECAARRRYVRPELGAGFQLEIRGGRHPVVETMMPADQYIPNDVLLDEDRRIAIMTGPNMAGKSTILRMVGLIQLLAQVGAFVPADAARLGVVDRIFTRVGASDDVVRGQSTFMVEATECATVLNGATGRSLVLMDEVGRGTATWDGVSLAWAIVEHLHGVIGAKAIFATHYHELTELAEHLPQVFNTNVAVSEEGERIVFLHRLVAGGADRSYGIEVARLAGVPQPVIARAREILHRLERTSAASERSGPARRTPAPEAAPARGVERAVAARILALDVDRTTPVAALNLLAQLHATLSADASGEAATGSVPSAGYVPGTGGTSGDEVVSGRGPTMLAAH